MSRRLTRGAQALGYLLASVPLALLAIPAALALLARVVAPARWVMRLDRRLANRLLGLQIPPISPDRGRPRIVAHLALRAPLTAGLLVAALLPVALLAEVVRLGVDGLVGAGGVDYVGWWSLGPGLGLVLLALAVPAAVLAVAELDGVRTVLCSVTRALLVPRAPLGGPVREMLAESLGDHTVSIAYWLPDRERFVDETGRPVELPAPGSGRSVGQPRSSTKMPRSGSQ